MSMKEIKMTEQKKDDTNKKQGGSPSPRPATQTTPGNPDDPRSKTGDLIENDNEEKLGEKNLDSKFDKTGG
jgi:hypothetical protein